MGLLYICTPLNITKKQVDYLYVKPLLRPCKNRDIHDVCIIILNGYMIDVSKTLFVLAFFAFFHVVFQSPPISSTKNT